MTTIRIELITEQLLALEQALEEDWNKLPLLLVRPDEEDYPFFIRVSKTDPVNRTGFPGCDQRVMLEARDEFGERSDPLPLSKIVNALCATGKFRDDLPLPEPEKVRIYVRSGVMFIRIPELARYEGAEFGDQKFLPYWLSLAGYRVTVEEPTADRQWEIKHQDNVEGKVIYSQTAVTEKDAFNIAADWALYGSPYWRKLQEEK